MANETILKFCPEKTLEANGAAIANNAIVQAAAASYDVSADGGAYQDARFGLSFTFGTAPTEGTVLALYAQPLDINGGNAEAPKATRPSVFVGSFVVSNVTTTQYAELIARDVPWKANYYLHNNGTGQSVSAGWKLTVTPFTVAPAS
ncbi:hypothetical protein [Azonexus sp.]|uniref:hypothetical protein n=1 Tax=Azonexus sp. TaxID=1872668 RepID=UPI00283A844A|nr:hypothetical protein [Azonexus sp.]MDR1995148.1 hypothetical protein [Azonexus sp.]